MVTCFPCMMTVLRFLPAFCVCWAGVLPGVAQENAPQPVTHSLADTTSSQLAPSDSVTVRASTQYQAGKFKTWLLGRNYRREWAQPVRVPVLNLPTLHGGLTPLKQGGGLQTKSLRLKAADGREYVLRSVEKNTEQVLSQEFRNTVAANVVQDQISASHPYAALTVPLLAEAAGVGHTSPQLVWVPDTDQLGEFRGAFCNTLALLEEREPAPPTAWGTPARAYSTDKVLELLREDPRHRVDQRAVLRARLFDVFIADWDRHDDQWRWVGYAQPDGSLLLRALPRDRDQALFVNQGVLPKVASRKWALGKIQGFDGSLRDVPSFMFNGRYFDRSFLTELTREDWLTQAAELQASLPDAVIEQAVRQWPDSVFRLSGPTIIAQLKANRDALPRYAEEYYRFLAQEVDVAGSDQAELFAVQHLDKARTQVSVYALNSPAPRQQPRYQRTFFTAETRELRVFANGGRDVVEVSGPASQGLRVRVIGGEGEDTIRATGGTRTFVYDTPTGNQLSLGAAHDRTASDSTVNQYDRKAYRYAYLGPLLPLAYNIDDGIFLGLGVEVRRPGFRKEPWAAVHRLQGNVALATGAFNFHYNSDFIHLLGKTDLLLRADLQAPNYVRNFFGLGNDTDFDSDRGIRYYRVRFRNIAVQALARRRLGQHWEVYGGPFYQNVRVERSAGRFLDQVPDERLRPATLFGSKQYVGGKFGYAFDSRNQRALPTRGLHWQTEFTAFEGLNSRANSLSQLTSEASGYWTPLPHLTLATRVGGAFNFGDFEFFQAATLGGLNNLRGYRRTRFAGENSLYNNVEARARIGNFHTLLVSTDFGLLGFHDVGRVWVDGEDSDTWHTGYGGGVWFSPNERLVLTAMYGFSKEDSLPLVRLGFLF